MSFREKSAWVMGVVMTAAGLHYLIAALAASRAADWRSPPVDVFAPYLIQVIVVSVIAQVVLAIWSPKEADAPADERERPLIDRAGNWSGVLLYLGAASALWVFVTRHDANLLFHMIVGSLILQQIGEYALQIVFFRRNG